MKEPKQIVYRYDGTASSDEVVEDFAGEMVIPEKGNLIQRNGKMWKVVHVIKEETVAGPKAIPIYRVFLAS